tara:strand:+ start:231 stop:572 length:342 start_codon:yes stop_codon:yes gene_type:complete
MAIVRPNLPALRDGRLAVSAGKPVGIARRELHRRRPAVDCGRFYRPGSFLRIIRTRKTMAKATTIKVKLLSTADTGFFYVTRKNSRTMTDKITKTKYDPIARKHVEFRETKIK